MKPLSLFALVLLVAGCTDVKDPSPAQAVQPKLDWRPDMIHELEWIREVQGQAMSQYEMNVSASVELGMLNAQLYIALMDFAQECPLEQKEALFDSHMNWLDIRSDAGLRSRIPVKGGTMAPLLEISQMSHMTKARLVEFDSLSQNSESNCVSPENRSNVLALSDEGWGGIDGSIPFEESAISAAQADLELIRTPMENESGVWEALQFSYRGNHIGYFHPDSDNVNIGSIEFESEWSTGPTGELMGSEMSEIDPDRFACEPGMEEYSGHAVCKDAAYPRVTYVFENHWRWEGPDDELPPIERLHQGQLVRLFWHAE